MHVPVLVTKSPILLFYRLTRQQRQQMDKKRKKVFTIAGLYQPQVLMQDLKRFSALRDSVSSSKRAIDKNEDSLLSVPTPPMLPHISKLSGKNTTRAVYRRACTVSQSTDIRR